MDYLILSIAMEATWLIICMVDLNLVFFSIIKKALFIYFKSQGNIERGHNISVFAANRSGYKRHTQQ